MKEFQKELESLINAHSQENGSDTPDFLLAEYLVGCLDVWNKTLCSREAWYGRIINRRMAATSALAPEPKATE